MKFKKALTNIVISAVALGSVLLSSCNNTLKQDLSDSSIKKEIVIPEDSIAKYDDIFKHTASETKFDDKGRLQVGKKAPMYESLYKQEIFPTKANSYSIRVAGVVPYRHYFDVISYVNKNVLSGDEKLYDERFSGRYVRAFLEREIAPEKVNGDSFIYAKENLVFSDDEIVYAPGAIEVLLNSQESGVSGLSKQIKK